MKEKHDNLFKDEIQPKITGKMLTKQLIIIILYFHDYITLSTHECFISSS